VPKKPGPNSDGHAISLCADSLSKRSSLHCPSIPPLSTGPLGSSTSATGPDLHHRNGPSSIGSAMTGEGSLSATGSISIGRRYLISPEHRSVPVMACNPLIFPLALMATSSGPTVIATLWPGARGLSLAEAPLKDSARWYAIFHPQHGREIHPDASAPASPERPQHPATQTQAV